MRESRATVTSDASIFRMPITRRSAATASIPSRPRAIRNIFRRASLFEGQANFVNPGILLYNAGFDAKITPKLRSTLNVNWARFNRTEVLQAVLFQAHIRHDIGLDSGLGLQYRPLLTDNIVVS